MKFLKRKEVKSEYAEIESFVYSFDIVFSIEYDISKY